MSDKMNVLLNRWRDYMPAGAPDDKLRVGARLLEVQARHFANIDRKSELGRALEKVVGKDWHDTLLRGLGHALVKHPLLDIVAVHPSPDTTYKLPYLKREDGDKENTIDWRVLTREVECVQHDLGVRYYPMPVELPEMHQPICEFVFEEALNSILHSILGVGLNIGGQKGCWCPPDKLNVGVLGAQRVAYNASKRFPNTLVLSNGHQLYEGRTERVIRLPVFPGDKLLLLHKGHGNLFGSISWVPHLFLIHPSAEPETVSGTLEEFPKGLRVSIVHHISVSEPSSVVAVALSESAPKPEAQKPAEGVADDADEQPGTGDPAGEGQPTEDPADKQSPGLDGGEPLSLEGLVIESEVELEAVEESVEESGAAEEPPAEPELPPEEAETEEDPPE